MVLAPCVLCLSVGCSDIHVNTDVCTDRLSVAVHYKCASNRFFGLR